MPDPQDVTTATGDMAKDKHMDKIVGKALKKRKRRKRGVAQPSQPPQPKVASYDKLAMLVPSITKVLEGNSYGAAAGGFNPGVPVDSSNGITESKVSSPAHSFGKNSVHCWPGLQKVGISPKGMALGATAGAFSPLAAAGGIAGAGIGGLGGALFPEKDEETGENKRLMSALKYGLIGGGAGGLAGMGAGAVGGGMIGNDIGNNINELMSNPSVLKAIQDFKDSTSNQTPSGQTLSAEPATTGSRAMD